ncbi:hypothetical protein [Inquilinus limosus]|uniref:Uncharacterized protein n=1 Tax=Inquilinus limosus TaxID=171674 RepID=A0A211YWV9_9PROT|nr:hypothetical protein [Inquilinus limosus]OWJ57441.1 hypothetical protein BWR60_34200 [Inquilinus limosus]
MEMMPRDCGLEDGPVDPDLAWTRWALSSLGELVEIGLRTARMTATEQLATPIERTRPDFALAQVRLARSVRLSIAMSQRVRETYQDRKAGEADRTPAEKAADVATAGAAPPEAAPAEAAPAAGDGKPRAEPREALTESECLDIELESGDEAEERRDAALLPRDRDDGAAAAPDRLPPDHVPDAPAEAAAARPEPDWRRPSDESDTGRAVPKPSKPDTS